MVCPPECPVHNSCSSTIREQLISQTPLKVWYTNGMWVYVLECKTPGKFYVGSSSNLRQRLNDHITHRGSKFTKRYGVKRVVLVKETPNNWIHERDMMLKYCGTINPEYGKLG